jgi:hypothetical protein
MKTSRRRADWDFLILISSPPAGEHPLNFKGRRIGGTTMKIGDICPQLSDLKSTELTEPKSDNSWTLFCRLYEVAVKGGNREGFIPLGWIPGRAVIIRAGKVVAATDPDNMPLGDPTPEVLKAIEAWREIWENLGSLPTPWEDGVASRLLEKGEISTTLVMGIRTLEWQGEMVPLGVALRGHPQEREVEVVAVYNPANLDVPSVGTKMPVESLQVRRKTPLHMLLRVWAKLEAMVRRHTRLCSSFHQQVPPHFSQEQAQSHRPTKPNQRYRRRKR